MIQFKSPLIFALVGALSGALGPYFAAYALFIGELRLPLGIVLWSGNLVPGLIFGLCIGFLLLCRQVIGPVGYALYVAAATGSYWVAFTLAWIAFTGPFNGNTFLTGLAAGFYGSTCLTAFSAPFIRPLRRCKSWLRIVLTGSLLGGLMPIALRPLDFVGAMIFFALWEAGYAGMLAAALLPAKKAER